MARPDRLGEHRTAFDKNRKIILARQTVCGICGQPVDQSIKYPHPLSPTIDHIIPVAKGGHPSDLDNLQLAHRCCNRQKSDKLYLESISKKEEERTVRNNDLPQHFDWAGYEAKDNRGE